LGGYWGGVTWPPVPGAASVLIERGDDLPLNVGEAIGGKGAALGVAQREAIAGYALVGPHFGGHDLEPLVHERECDG
jgi:hypothetical protein